MDKTRIKDQLALHGFSHNTLDSGVRVSALVSGSSDGEREDLEIIVRAAREGTRLESERHCSYADAATRYVELVGKYREDFRSPAHGPV